MSELLTKHPAFLSLLSSLILAYFYIKNKKLFKFLTIILPIMVLIKFCRFEEVGIIDLFGFKLEPLRFNEYNKIIGIALLLSHISASLYAISNKQFIEIIYSNIYAAASIFVLLSHDFICMFSGFELMMIISSVIIFLGRNKNSSLSSMRYFIFHLTAGMCLIVGICLISQSGASRELKILTIDLSDNFFIDYNIGCCFILLSCLINIGAPPFSAWITDAYPQAKTSGTVYLSIYTTKIAAYCLLIFFSGCKLLIPLGFIMMLYGCFYSILENNLRRIICFQVISQLGIILIAIGLGEKKALVAAILLIFSHILYSTLLFIIVGIFIDQTNVKKATDMSKIDVNIDLKPLIIGGFIGILSLLAFPYSGPFLAKMILGKLIYEYSNILYIVYLIANILLIISLPWQELIKLKYNISMNNFQKKHLISDETPQHNSLKHSKITELTIFVSAIICLFSGIISLIIFNFIGESPLEANLSSTHIANQILFNLTAVILGIICYKKNHKTKNLLLTFDYFYRKFPDVKFKNVSFERNRIIKEKLNKIVHKIIIQNKNFFSNSFIISNSPLIVVVSFIVILVYLARISGNS